MTYGLQEKYAEAVAAFDRALAIREKLLGPDHPAVAQTLNNLGSVRTDQGKYSEAITAITRALAIIEKTLGLEHPKVAAALNNLAVVYVSQRDWAAAVAMGQRATTILERRSVHGTAEVRRPLASKGRTESERNYGYYLGLVKAAYRHSKYESKDAHAMFLKAQWTLSSGAATALTNMAARGAKGDSELAKLVRERQDQLAEWQRLDQVRTAVAARPPLETRQGSGGK